MRIGILCQGHRVAAWQARALAELGPGHDFLVYNCTTRCAERRKLRHALYYLLNLFAIRNRMTRPVPLGTVVSPVKSVDFAAEADGLWQRLPADLLAAIAEDRPAVLLKFGMNLLRIPPRETLAVPILSYHHGDPDHYRGRPAGFYELLHGRAAMGQIVQVLSNRLDAGSVVAAAETKVWAHSYRSTLVEAFSRSPLLLAPAIRNAIEGVALPKPCSGRNYRLPGNATVARFMLKMAAAVVRRLAYGAFFEKRWSVSTVELAPELVGAGGEPALPPPDRWRTLPLPPGYAFLADPFFAGGTERIYVEALLQRTGEGEILLYEGESWCRVLAGQGHCSYPAPFELGGERFVVPEICFWSDAAVYRLGGEGLERVAPLDVPGDKRLIDPTLLRQDGEIYLFANRLSENHGVLRLWRAPDLFARFEEHPCSPIRISPAGSRMAGPFLRSGGSLLRLGQDLRGDYGDGILVYRIDRLDRHGFSETQIGRLALTGVKGPHTLDFAGSLAVFDWYRDRFSPLAGVRRFFARRRASAAQKPVSEIP